MRNCILFIRIVNASLNNHLVLKKRCDFYDKFGNLKMGLELKFNHRKKGELRENVGGISPLWARIPHSDHF